MTVQKRLLYEQKLQKELEIPFSQYEGRLQIQDDSFLTLTACTSSENWMKGMRKQEYIYAFCFLAKIVTTETWPSRVLNYLNENYNWTITPLSHISLIWQYYFLFKSFNYNDEKASHQRRQ